MTEGKVIVVSLGMFGKNPDSRTTKANEVARSFGLSDATSAEVKDFKAQLTKHNAQDLPFMGYVNKDGYGCTYVPGAAVVCDPYQDAHQTFLTLPKGVQITFAIRMLFTRHPVDRCGTSMFLYYQRGSNVKPGGAGANQY